MTSQLSFLIQLLKPWGVRVSLIFFAFIEGYDAAGNQFGWPKISEFLGRMAWLPPWWAWLLAVIVYSLFEYVRSIKTNGIQEEFDRPSINEAIALAHEDIKRDLNELRRFQKLIADHEIADSEANRLMPDCVDEPIASYRDVLDKAKLERGQHRVHIVTQKIATALRSLEWAMDRAAGISAPGIEPIFAIPKLKHPDSPVSDGENTFQPQGNEAYLWAHEENIRTATKFQQDIEQFRAELSASKLSAQAAVLHECQKISDLAATDS